MRIVFMGTPEFSVSFLRALAASSHEIVAVVTQPDRPAGRGHQLKAPAVKVAALELGLPVLQPENLRDPLFAEELAALQVDLSVVVAFSMLPKAVLAATRLGAVNLHGSLLPRFRGAAPVQWAVATGAKQTGCTVFRLDEKMDHGPILRQAFVPIGPNDTGMQVLQNMIEPGTQALLDALMALENNDFTEIPQDHASASPAPKLRKEDGLVQWDMPAQQIHDRIRGFSPWPGGYTLWRGKTLTIHGTLVLESNATKDCGHFTVQHERLLVNTGKGLLELLQVQLEGKKAITAAEFIRGLQGLTNGVFGV